MKANNPQDLEKLIHRTLRALPDRPAPRTLELRVLSAIAAQRALPWYRQSFIHWPVAAKAAFLSTSSIAAILLTTACTAGLEPLKIAASRLHSAISPFLTVLRALAESADTLVNAIPPLWLYGSLALIALSYLSLFGVSVTAYQVLRAKR